MGNVTSDQTTFDTGIAWRLAAMIIGSLITVFVLQRLGFRFVVAVGG